MFIYDYFSRLWPEARKRKTGFLCHFAAQEKIGTNFLFVGRYAPTNRRLLDRAVIFDFARPFDLIPKYREKCEASPAEGGASKQPIASDFEKSFIWSELLNEGRTYFEQQFLP